MQQSAKSRVEPQPPLAAPVPVPEAAGPRLAGFSAVQLDWIERALAVVVFAIFVVRIYDDYRLTQNPSDPLILTLEFMVVFFILVRRPAEEISVRRRDWAIALLGTCLPWAVAPSTVGAIGPFALGCSLMLAGMFAQIVTKLALNRNFGLVAARRKVVMGGPYRFVRHPIYLSYFIGHVGFLLLNPTLWNLGIYVACNSIQVARLLAEERVLGRDPLYRAYQQKVRYRVLPGIF